MCGDLPFFVFAHDAPTPVDQFEIIGEPEGQASGHVLARIMPANGSSCSNKHRHPLNKTGKVKTAIATGVLLDQIIVALACSDELVKSFSADHVLFPVKDKSIPRVLLSHSQTLDSGIRIILAAGK